MGFTVVHVEPRMSMMTVKVSSRTSSLERKGKNKPGLVSRFGRKTTFHSWINAANVGGSILARIFQVTKIGSFVSGSLFLWPKQGKIMFFSRPPPRRALSFEFKVLFPRERYENGAKRPPE